MRLPFPITSPTQNQQITSTPIHVFNQASLTVCFLQDPVRTARSKFPNPLATSGISVGFGGINSTRAYFMKIASFGFATVVILVCA